MGNDGAEISDFFAQFGSESALAKLIQSGSEVEKAAYLMFQEVIRLRAGLKKATEREQELINSRWLYRDLCTELGQQIDCYSVVDPGKLRSGVYYADTEGKKGQVFQSDSAGSIKAQAVHQRHLIRELARKEGFKLVPLARKKSPSRKKK